MSTPIYGFKTITDAELLGTFEDTVNSITQSIEDQNPHRYVASFAALNAMTDVTMYPNGQVAVLTVDDTGLMAGSTFIRRGGKWLFNSGATTDLPTFFAALTTNVGTMPGASFYDNASATSRIFTNTTGNSEILISGTSWTNITYSSGYQNTTYGDVLGYRLAPGGAHLRGHILRSNGKAIAAGAVIGNIPSAARPSNGQYFLSPGITGAVGSMLIQADGDIILLAPIARSSSWYSFDNVFLPRTS